MSSEGGVQADAGVADTKSSVQSGSWYLVVLCMVAYIFSFVDRQIVSLLIDHIRADLAISDTQFSLIHGLSFAIFYAAMGVPIARMADRKSRPLIIAVGIAVWSLATAVCGMAKSFWQLFFARMGVGVGEAALSPAAYSMISDSFPKEKLGLALGVYSIGSFIGSGLAFIIGGVAIDWVVANIGVVEVAIIGEIKPWQMTFFLVGLPGLIIAALFYLTVIDPPRKGGGNEQGYTLGQVFGYIKQHKKAFSAHYLGFGLQALVLFVMLSWSPAYLLRNFGLSTKEVGLYLGGIVLVCNVAGVLFCGWLIDFFSNRGRTDAAMYVGILGGIGTLLPVALFSFMGTLQGSLILMGVAFFFVVFPMTASAVALQVMAPNRMRAQVTAFFFLFMNLFGITGGATLVALCTDYVFNNEQMVGYSMSLVGVIGAVIAIVVMSLGLSSYRSTVESLESSSL